MRKAAALVVLTGSALALSAALLPERADAGSFGSFVGRVVDVCGRPVVRASVGPVRSSPVVSIPLIGIHTNARGYYRWDSLRPARYWVEVLAEGYRRQVKTVRVRVGRTSRLNFRLRLAGSRRCPPSLAG